MRLHYVSLNEQFRWPLSTEHCKKIGHLIYELAILKDDEIIKQVGIFSKTLSSLLKKPLPRSTTEIIRQV